MALTVRRVLQLKGVVGVHKVAPDATVKSAFEEFERRKVSALMVVGEDGDLRGLLRKTDIVAAIDGDAVDDERVADHMIDDLQPCGLADDARAVLRRVAARGLRHLPVVDADTLVGVITTGDMARAISRDGALNSLTRSTSGPVAATAQTV